MHSPPSPPAPRPASGGVRTQWSVALGAPPRGLALAREKCWLLTWDEHGWLYLLNRRGERLGQMHRDGPVVTACCADDGSACAAAGSQGEVWWLAPDLMTRWQGTVTAAPLAL